MDATGAVTATNTFGAAGLLSRRSGGASTFYTFDERGSVVQRLDGAGAVVSSHLYDAYGVGSSSVATGDPFGFGGQWGYYRDAETGLELCTFRYYSAGAGRWLSRDPIEYAGGVNLYGYVENGPLIYFDPSGERARGVVELIKRIIAFFKKKPASGPKRAVKQRPNTPKWPKLSEPYTQAEIGEIVGWGRAVPGAQDALKNLCKADISRIKGKLSRDAVEKIRNFYRDWGKLEQKNETARQREKLLDEILKQWND
jgi:RHS repeat-associated protein